ncbi:hypothetical protein JRQ81_019345, partial [Phrynocephalus forsythii]
QCGVYSRFIRCLRKSLKKDDNDSVAAQLQFIVSRSFGTTTGSGVHFLPGRVDRANYGLLCMPGPASPSSPLYPQRLERGNGRRDPRLRAPQESSKSRSSKEEKASASHSFASPARQEGVTVSSSANGKVGRDQGEVKEGAGDGGGRGLEATAAPGGRFEPGQAEIQNYKDIFIIVPPRPFEKRDESLEEVSNGLEVTGVGKESEKKEETTEAKVDMLEEKGFPVGGKTGIGSLEGLEEKERENEGYK